MKAYSYCCIEATLAFSDVKCGNLPGLARARLVSKYIDIQTTITARVILHAALFTSIRSVGPLLAVVRHYWRSRCFWDEMHQILSKQDWQSVWMLMRRFAGRR